MRQLASIKVVNNILPIEGKDRIELAIIDGWSVIVKKDEFKVWDQCVYIEIDSVLPEKPEFEFLRKNKFRIRTMKMSGVISQGICFPLSILPIGTYSKNQDVTNTIGVTQYAPAMDTETSNVTQANKAKFPKWLMKIKFFRRIVYKFDHRESKGFPSFISKTDETRIQNMPWVLENKDAWIATEKVDGQSGTFALVKHKRLLPFFKPRYEYIVCSRNLRLFQKDSRSYWSVSDLYHIEDVLKQMIGDNEWIAIQGECVAANVQGNKYKVTTPDLYVFNLISPTGRWDSVSAKKGVEYYGMKFVPILDRDYHLPDTVNEVLDYAHGESAIGDTLREGVVFRSMDGKSSFKAVDPLFLIKYEE